MNPPSFFSGQINSSLTNTAPVPMDPSLIDSSQSARDPQDRASDSVGIAREIYTALTLTEDPSTYKNLNDIDNAATSISMVIAESRAEDLLNHSRGLGRVAQAMRDLQFYLGGVQDTQFFLGRLKAQVPSALGKYRQHLLDVLSRCKTAGLQPDEELLFALSMYACTCAQTVSDEMRERATSIVVAGDIGNEGVGVYALFASFLSHERADVLFALKAGVLAFEMSLL